MAVKLTHKVKVTGDVLHLDHTDVTLGKGTIVAVAPDPNRYPESYALFHERALVIADLWNTHLYTQEILEGKLYKDPNNG
jgi:hypothetical protein